MTTLLETALIHVQMNDSGEVFITEKPSGVTCRVSTEYDRGLTVTAHVSFCILEINSNNHG